MARGVFLQKGGVRLREDARTSERQAAGAAPLLGVMLGLMMLGAAEGKAELLEVLRAALNGAEGASNW
jgi:hypothetical protein